MDEKVLFYRKVRVIKDVPAISYLNGTVPDHDR